MGSRLLVVPALMRPIVRAMAGYVKPLSGILGLPYLAAGSPGRDLL